MMDTMPAAARPSVNWYKLARLIAAAIGLAVPTAARAQTQANWLTGTSGNWTDPTLWSTNPNFPNNGQPTAGTTYAANIAAAGTYTVTLNAPVTVTSLLINNQTATLALTSGANLTIVSTATLAQGTLRMTGGTLTGGTLTASGGRLIADSSTANTLSGVQIGANVVDLSAANSVLRLINGSTFTGLNTFAIGGGGLLRVEQSGTLSNLDLTLGTAAAPSSTSLQLYGGQTVTLASSVTVTAMAGGTNNNVGASLNFGDLGTNNLTNLGKLQATAANAALSINPSGTFTNGPGGQVTAGGGGTINLAAVGGWTNQGSIIVNNGTLNLRTDFNTAGIGTVNRTGGAVNLLATANATGVTFDLQSFGGNVNLRGGRVLGGTMMSSGTARLIPDGSSTNLLDGVQIGANALDISASGTVLRLVNGATFSALNTLSLGGISILRVEESDSPPGTPILRNLNLTLGTAASPSAAALQLFGGQNVTLAPTVTVTSVAGGSNNNVGSSLNYGDSGTNNLTSQGTLQATATNVTLRINPSGTFTNAAGGQVTASSGGTIDLSPGAGWTNQGTITVNNGTLNLNTDFSTAGIGTVSRTGGTVNLRATATTAAAGTFDLQSFGGNVNLQGGRILGGTLTSTSTARLIPNSDFNNRLDGVQIGANALDLSASPTVLRLVNGTNFSALNTLALGGNSVLRVEQTGTLNNFNLTLGTAASPSNATLQLFGGQNVTLGSTVTVTAMAGGTNDNVGSSLNYGDSGTNNLTSQGILQATAANVTLRINPSGTFTNGPGGQVIASGTGTINLAPVGGWTNQGTITVNNGTLNLPTDFATAGIGTVSRTGGTVNLLATATTAPAGTFDVQSFGGNVNFQGGRILGGTLTSTGSARLVPNFDPTNNALDGVSVSGNVLDMSAGNAVVRLLNGTNFTAPASLSLGTQSAVRLEQSGTLNNLNLTLNANNAALQLFGGRSVTLGSSVTVTATALNNNNVGTGIFLADNGTNNLTSAGVLQATTGNGVLNINPTGTFTNAAGGQVIASGTGTVNIQPTAGWTNQGTFTVNNGTLNLNTDFTAAGIGTISRTGGTINLRATLNSTGTTFDVQSFGGNLTLAGGRILGGTLTSSGGARLVPNSDIANNRLDGVMVTNNALDMSASNSTVRLINGTNFTAPTALSLGASSAVRVEQSGTLNNLNLTMTANNGALQLFGGQTVTLASSVTVTAGGNLSNNVGAAIFLADNGTNNLTNLGTLQATAAGTTLTINPTGAFTNGNTGNIRASGGGTVAITPTNWTNNGTITVGTAAGDTSRVMGNVFVNNGGLLRGFGSLPGPVTITSGGRLHPGSSPGTLTITGAVTMAAGASYEVELTSATPGAGYSQLNLAGGGSIDLAGSTLVTTLSYAPAAVDSFTIITGGAVAGIFGGLPNGSPVLIGNFGGTDYVRFIQYGATSVLLSPVPEPGHILLLAAAAAFVWRRRNVVAISWRRA